MLRILFTLLAVLCVLIPLSHTAPVMSYFNVSNKPIQPRRPEAKKIIPLPYREPAPVYEVQEEDDLDYELRNNVIQKSTRPIKYGFVNPKTRYYDPRIAYNYNKRFIYTNLVY